MPQPRRFPARLAALAASLAIALDAGAGVTQTATGGTLTTTVTPGTQAARISVSIAPGPGELDSTQKMYFALFLPSGMILFRSGSDWHVWNGGTIPALYAHAQSECRSGAGFGYHVDFPGFPDLEQLRQLGLGGSTFYAGYGRDEADMITQRKYAPIYSVPR